MTTPGNIQTGIQIRGSTFIGSVTVPTAVGAYSADDVIGSSSLTGLELVDAVRMNNGKCLLQKLIVIDNDKLAKALNIWIFNQAITAQVDNAALTLTDAEMLAKCETRISVAASDYTTAANNSVAVIRNLADPVQAQGSQASLFVVVTAGEAITFLTTNALTIKFGDLPD